MNELWHSLRAENIGGSEIAALFGESPYLTYYRLWQEKRGGIGASDLSEDERVQAGKFLEAGAIEWANSKWNTSFYQPKVYIKHPSVHGMGCTPYAFDYEAPVMAQVKIVDSLQFALKWKAEGDTVTEAPLDILLQVQHEMECAQREQSWLIVLVGGNRLYRMVCAYDPEIGSMLRKAVMEFWMSAEPPKPDFKRDGETISQIRQKLPAVEATDLSDDDYLYDVSKKALAAKVARDRAQDALDAANAEVNYLVGNAKTVKCKDMLMKYHKGRKNPEYQSTGEIAL
jgi:putative phage-type endonuclease